MALTLRTDAELEAALTALAEAEGTSRQEVIRRSVLELHSIARNHALADRDKRLAWLATVVFLDINHHTAGIKDDAAFALVMDVAAGNQDLDDIAQRLQVVSV